MAEDFAALKLKFTPQPGKVIERKPQVCTARFSADGKQLVAGGFDGLISRWDLTQDALPELPAVTGHDGWVIDIVFEPSGAWAISADSWGQLRCWSTAEPNQTPRWVQAAAHDGWIQALVMSPDGQFVATCGNDRLVRVWSVETGQKVHEFSGHTAPVLRLAWHPAQPRLASGDLHGRVKLWDVAAVQPAGDYDASSLYKADRLQETGGVRSLAYSLDGLQLAVGGTKVVNGGNVQGTPTVLIFETATGTLSKTLELGGTGDVYVAEMLFHPAGFLMAVISGNPGVGKLVFRQLDAAEPFVLLTNMANCHSLCLHPNGLRLAVVATNGGSQANGRQLDKDGEYADNFSPIHLLDFPAM